MKPLFTLEQLETAKCEEMLPCECYHCREIFFKTKRQIKDALNINNHKQAKYCSRQCYSASKITSIQTKCKFCSKDIFRRPTDIKRTKNSFCNHSCAIKHNKKIMCFKGSRSKLEKHLEIELMSLFPQLEFLFNRRDIIDSELDIYIPSLKLAFELNGIFHYEPIFGRDKLEKIQNNDRRKIQACLEKEIRLYILDTSKNKYFKIKYIQPYLDIIVNLINTTVEGGGLKPKPSAR